jgi:hypothetical protein
MFGLSKTTTTGNNIGGGTMSVKSVSNSGNGGKNKKD